ncbi:HPP family protein [Halochromatium glycolicum]|nr:CBS domain-containing protein [Halochromatium glycolicum]
MMASTTSAFSAQSGDSHLVRLDLTEEDVIDAMRHIPGYLDISTEDFRVLYQFASEHAIGRLFKNLRAGDLMLSAIRPLQPQMRLGEAAREITGQRLKSLPVVDEQGRVIGILTETDFLHCMGANSYLQLLLNLAETQKTVSRRCSNNSVGEMMSSPVITVGESASVNEIITSFARHDGRSMPVVDSTGQLRGLLLRKEFVRACRLPGLS